MLSERVIRPGVDCRVHLSAFGYGSNRYLHLTDTFGFVRICGYCFHYSRSLVGDNRYHGDHSQED